MIKAIRGTRDLLPPETATWNFVEATARDVFRAYNFQEIRTPIFEATELFARGVGEETDIVSKEMYTWEDGERFDKKKLVDEWLKVNQSTELTQVQAGRINVQGTPSFLERARQLGVEFQVWRGIQVPKSYALSGRIELVAFASEVSSEAVTALKKALAVGKKEYPQDFGSYATLLRLVIPADAAKSSPWVSTEDVEVEAFPGNFFSSSQSLTLRPENTAGVVRAYIENKLDRAGTLQKLFYIGPQFRRERPQKGRYRQFYQIGAEVIGPPTAGSESPARDAEVLEMLDTLLDRLGIEERNLQLNSVGCANDRPRYLEALREALKPVIGQMCQDCQRRAETNPLRVLDCKVPEDQPIIEKLPRISQYLDESCRQHFAEVRAILDACGVPYVINDRLVRGLDYYTRTAFEFTHGALGAQNAILGGGRYDGLSEAIGGPKAPGIGFAIGEDRLVMSIPETAASAPRKPDAYIAPMGPGMNKEAARLARELRHNDLVIELGDETFRLKKSLETASKLGARFAVILGENEAKSGQYAVKDLAKGEQVTVSAQELPSILKPA